MFYQIVSLFCSHGIHCFHWSQYHLYFSLKATSSSGVTWEHQTKFSSMYTLTSTLYAIMQHSKDYITFFFRGLTAELWCCKSQAFPPILMITHLLKPQPQGSLFSQIKALNLMCVSWGSTVNPKSLKHSRGLVHSSMGIFPPTLQKFTSDPFFLFLSPKGFKSWVKKPSDMRTAWRHCTFICLIFNFVAFGAINIISGFRNQPEAVVKLQDYAESGRRVESTLLTE